MDSEDIVTGETIDAEDNSGADDNPEAEDNLKAEKSPEADADNISVFAEITAQEASEDDDLEEEILEEEISEDEVKRSSTLINPAYNGLLPISLLAALIGMLLGPIPVIAIVLIAGSVFYPLFVVAPLLMYFFNSLLKGGRDIRALIVTAVFSFASAYMAALACQAAIYTSFRNFSVFQIPTITALIFGRSGALPASASAYVYPLIFTALGVVIAAEMMRGKAEENQA